MARTVTADAEDFARLSFRLVEERGSGGTWFAARDLLEAAASAHPAHPFVRALAEKPGRRIVFSAAAERVRRSEFAHIERRRRGTRRNAAVSYRLTRPMLVGGGAGRTAPQAALGPTPQPSTPGTCVGGLPACVPGADRGSRPPKPVASGCAPPCATFVAVSRPARASRIPGGRVCSSRC